MTHLRSLLAVHSLVVLVALVAASPPSAAQSGPAAPLGESLTGAAKIDYDAGRGLYAERDFAGALIKFTAAWEASKDPRLLWNMASCEGKRHHYTKALALLRSFVREGGARITDADRREAAQLISSFEPLTSTATIEVSPAGADVLVDGEPVGKSPLPPLALDVGVHAVRAHKDEFVDANESVTVSGGASVPLRIRLAPVVHEGRLVVRAPAKAAISLDDVPLAVGEWSGPVKSGGHTLRVTAEGMIAHQSEVLVQDRQTREVAVSLEPEKRAGGVPTWAWVAGGVVVAGALGTGGYFLFKPSSKGTTPPTGTIGTVPSDAAIRF